MMTLLRAAHGDPGSPAVARDVPAERPGGPPVRPRIAPDPDPEPDPEPETDVAFRHATRADEGEHEDEDDASSILLPARVRTDRLPPDRPEPSDAGDGAGHGFAVAAVPAVGLAVRDVETGETFEATIDRAFSLCGRSGDLELPLDHPDVSVRHAALHPVGSRLLVIDLASRTGVRWGAGAGRGETRRGSGWLAPGRTVRVGPFELRNTQPEALPPAGGFGEDDPFTAPPAGTPPRVRLVGDGWHDGPRSVTLVGPVARVGRGKKCELRAVGEDVSRVSALLVRAADGLWAVDLRGRSGLRVAGEPVHHDGDRARRLEPGDRVEVPPATLEIETPDPARERIVARVEAVFDVAAELELAPRVPQHLADLRRAVTEAVRDV